MRSYLFPSVVTLQVYDAARSEWPRPLILSYEPILGLQVDSAAPLLSHRPSFGLQSERINSPKKTPKKQHHHHQHQRQPTRKKKECEYKRERERERERERKLELTHLRVWCPTAIYITAITSEITCAIG